MKNDGPLGIYARRKYECRHGCPRFREELGILGQCEGMPANDREKELVFRGSSRLQLDPVGKCSKVVTKLTQWVNVT